MTQARPPLPGYDFAPHWHIHGNQLKQHYLDEGVGEPVVMLHGNPSWSYYWRNLVSALRGTYRCIVPDHIGMGWSDKPGLDRYDYKLQSRIDDLDALLAKVVPTGPVTLIVHDWGGMIGMGWALRHPERVKRVVFLNTAAFPMPKAKSLPFLLGLVRNTGLGAFLVNRLNFFAWGATWMGVAKRMPPEIKAAYLAPYDTPAHRLGTLRFVQDIPLSDKDPGYALLVQSEALLADRISKIPVMLGWGLKDFVFDKIMLERFQVLLPQAEVHAFADADHYVMEDTPERLCPLIADFLRRSD